MTDQLLNVATFDPFAEEEGTDAVVGKSGKSRGMVHIRVQKRNGRKSLTTVSGLPQKLNYTKIVKVMKKSFNCNGTVIEDDDLGKIIQLQGDQRKEVVAFLTHEEIVAEDHIKVHGF